MDDILWNNMECRKSFELDLRKNIEPVVLLIENMDDLNLRQREAISIIQKNVRNFQVVHNKNPCSKHMYMEFSYEKPEVSEIFISATPLKKIPKFFTYNELGAQVYLIGRFMNEKGPKLIRFYVHLPELRIFPTHVSTNDATIMAALYNAMSLVDRFSGSTCKIRLNTDHKLISEKLIHMLRTGLRNRFGSRLMEHKGITKHLISCNL